MGCGHVGILDVACLKVGVWGVVLFEGGSMGCGPVWQQ